jgi:hypothetical protein
MDMAGIIELVLSTEHQPLHLKLVGIARLVYCLIHQLLSLSLCETHLEMMTREKGLVQNGFLGENVHVQVRNLFKSRKSYQNHEPHHG